MIIELLHSTTKSKSILIKPYFIDNQEFIPDSLTSTKIPLAKASSTKISLPKTPQLEISLVDITPIKPANKSLLATLAFLTLVKQGYR